MRTTHIRHVAAPPRVCFLALPASLLALVSVCVLFGTVAPSASAETCPKEQVRQEDNSTTLPDCRAYEQVSPTEKNGNQAYTSAGEEPSPSGFGVARADGAAILYSAGGPIGNTATGFDPFSVSQRFPEGWRTRAVLPRPTGVIGFANDTPSNTEISADFSHFVFVSPGPYAAAPDGNRDPNIFLAGQDPFAEPQWIGAPGIENPNPPLGNDGDAAGLDLAGGSPDLSTVYFSYFGTLVKEDEPRAESPLFKEEMEKKIEDPTFGSHTWGFYEWRNGSLSSAGVLPNGRTSALGAVAAAIAHQGTGLATPDNFDNQVSVDGTRAFFVSPDPEFCNRLTKEAEKEACRETTPTQLYVRESEGTGTSERRRTVLVSQDTLLPKIKEVNSEGREEEYPASAPRGVLPVIAPVHPPDPSYVVASPDGSHAFFESVDPLTGAAREAEESGSIKAGAPKEYDFNVNTDTLTYLPGVTDGEGDSAAVLVSSSGGSRFLFEEKRRHGQAPELALWSEGPSGGHVTEIAELLPPAPNAVDKGGLTVGPSRAANDGSVFAFETDSPLPQATNALGGGGANNGGGWNQVYRYSISAGTLSCVSCPPHGITPSGDARLSENDNQGGNDTGPGINEPIVGSRGMSGDGSQVFFDTPDPLLPQDINGKRDVYEWEQEGAGGCHTGQLGGCVYLISSGTGPHESFFIDNSESGEDVFLATADALVPGDTDNGYDIYDARVGGGFTVPSAPAACSGDPCQGPLAAGSPNATPAGSATFSGGANLAPASTASTARPRTATRAQELTRALRACRTKRSKRVRASCEARARRKYGRTARANKTAPRRRS